jgi:hypothetical protein
LKKSKKLDKENWKGSYSGDWYGIAARQRLQAFFNNASISENNCPRRERDQLLIVNSPGRIPF